MTVKELKEKLNDYPDDYLILGIGDYGDWIAEATKITATTINTMEGEKQGLLFDIY